jgi:hypothetical protein
MPTTKSKAIQNTSGSKLFVVFDDEITRTVVAKAFFPFSRHTTHSISSSAFPLEAIPIIWLWVLAVVRWHALVENQFCANS